VCLAAPILYRPASLGVAAGGQDGPPGRLEGQQQAHPPSVASGRSAGTAAPQEEAFDRYRCRWWRDVADPSERHLGDGLQFDTTADGRTLKMLNVIDEFTREALAIHVDRCIDADGVVAVLDRLALQHGAPAYLRFDNGPEFVAQAVNDWCRFNSAGSLFIDPGSPWQNAWVESFNGRLRDELLNLWHFDSLLEARVITEDWRRDYNTNRPHSAHGELTPTEFALQWTTTHQPQAA
jgi:putative transposase